MKALITAAGKGTRLRPITHTINKHLIPLANKPMIFYAIEKVIEAGIKEIGIIIKEGGDEEIVQIIRRAKFPAKFTFIEQVGGALGLAHCIKIAKKFIQDDDFIFYLGDNLIFTPLDQFIQKFKKEKLNSLLALSVVKDPQRFGVPEIKNGKIVKVEEKPANPKSNFAVTGIYFYDKNVFKAVENIKPSARGELEISDVNSWLIDRHFKVGFKEISGWWKDTGKPEDLLEGNQMALKRISPVIKGEVSEEVVIQGEVIVEKGAKVFGRKTVIRGPAIIGRESIIGESYIGPFTSIGSRCEIYNTEIENSIILNETDINCGERIVDSLIGLNSSITSAKETFPKGHKLIIGSQSQVEL